MRIEEGADGIVALGHPWTFVEESRSGVKRRVVDIDRCAAKRSHARDRFFVEHPIAGIPEEFAAASREDAESEAAKRQAFSLPCARIGIGSVEALRSAQHFARVARR